MKIIKWLIGDTFYSLINFVESNHNNIRSVEYFTINPYFNKLRTNSTIPSLLSIFVFIAIIMMLNILFILPYTIMMFSVNVSMPVMTFMIYIPVLSFWVVSYFSFRLILKGKRRGLIIFKYMILIECFLFCLSVLFSAITHEVYLLVKIINMGVFLWCRHLMNSRSFDEMVRNYIYRRLFREGSSRLS